MTEKGRFDPRFNPAFQRGFDPSAQRAARANQTPSLSADDVVYGRSAPMEIPAPPPPPAEQAPDGAPDDEENQATRGHNPFVLALWLLFVVFIAGGIALLLGPASGFRDGSAATDSDLAVMLIAQVFGPCMIAVGLATLSGLLFWHAAEWKRRKR